MADLAECRIYPIGRCRDRDDGDDLEAVGRRRLDLRQSRTGDGQGHDKRSETSIGIARPLDRWPLKRPPPLKPG